MNTVVRIFFVASTAVMILCGAVSFAADHREAPLIAEDLSADIADVYAFISPNDPNNMVLAMTVNGFTAPSENITYNFSPNVRYSFLVDNTDDLVPDHTAHITFSPHHLGPQTFEVEIDGRRTFSGNVTLPTEEPVPNPPIINPGPHNIQAFAGPRDDPFFFDVVGFHKVLAGTGTFDGTDGFAGFNTSAIVLEVPIAWAAQGQTAPFLHIWSETARRKVTLRQASDGKLEKHSGGWEQVERMGNPGINTALITPDLKDAYNIGQPANDANDFAPTIVNSLTALGTSQQNIAILASVAVPDTLKVDVNGPIGYPNGRNLDDDVIDTLFFFIFNQSGVSDLVDANDKAFLNSFPYLADPFQP